MFFEEWKERRIFQLTLITELSNLAISIANESKTIPQIRHCERLSKFRYANLIA